MRAWAEIDLSAFRQNLNSARKAVGNSCKIMAIVKANAYGHGAVPIAKTLLEAGADWLGVATAEEGAELRDSNIDSPILILSSTLDEELPLAVEHNLVPTISSPDQLREYAEFARSSPLPFQIKVDTGMRRCGIDTDQLWRILETARSLPSVSFQGIYSHFASSEGEELSLARRQLEEFRKILAELDSKFLRPPLAHIANSGAIFNIADSHFDLVRQGITLCGLYPSDALRRYAELKPALTLKARIVAIRNVKPGEGVGYEHTFSPTRSSLIATISIGYEDGYSVLYSNQASAIVRGKRVPVVGRVSMDYTTVDVTGVPDVRVRDEVILIGRSGSESVSAEELAHILGSVPHEVTCSIGNRVRRLYQNGLSATEHRSII